MDSISPDLDEEELLACVKGMATVLHELTGEGHEVDAIFGALNMRFMEMAGERAGKDTEALNAKTLFPALTADQQEQTAHCHIRLRTKSEALQGEGFSADAVMWSLIAAARNLLRMSGQSPEQIEKMTGDLLTQFQAVRRPKVIYL